MLVYAEHITPRLQYIAGFILGELLGLPPVFTSDWRKAESSGDPVIWYTAKKPPGGIHIVPAGLCSQTGIKRQVPGISRQDDEVFLFPVAEGSLPFDIFSASFYMITRYEEYLPFKADRHGRFPSSESLARKEGFLGIPVVNRWTNRLSLELKKVCTTLELPRPKASFLPTIDIDTAWVYRNRGFYRTARGLAHQLLGGYWQSARERMAVLSGSRRDPFDTYDYIAARHGADLTLFMLAGPGGKFDLNNPVTNPSWKKLVKDISDRYNLGFHPSYHTPEDEEMYHREIRILEAVAGRSLNRVRQHFLRLTFPGTYRRSLAAGFTEDYSMGYADQTGFRAGTSSSFLFYDLEYEKVSNLRVFPFVLMDRTLKDYLGLSTGEAKTLIKDLAETVKHDGGLFIPVWHNDSLGDNGEWRGWRDVYEYMLTLTKALF